MGHCGQSVILLSDQGTRESQRTHEDQVQLGSLGPSLGFKVKKVGQIDCDVCDGVRRHVVFEPIDLDAVERRVEVNGGGQLKGSPQNFVFRNDHVVRWKRKKRMIVVDVGHMDDDLDDVKIT